MTPTSSSQSAPQLVFIGGGNMAGAIVGGLVRDGRPPGSIAVVEPGAARRDELERDFGVRTFAEPDASLAAAAAVVVWAVKPQVFGAAAAASDGRAAHALQLSVMAGVRIDAIAAATRASRVVRAMPNTPALIGQGIAGLCANEAVTASDRQQVEAVLAPTGASFWVEREDELDAVTALSGSGPAYVYYLLEAMVDAAAQMGIDPALARRLAVATFAGSTALAAASHETLGTLRQRVTSPGGTTAAAIAELQAAGVGPAFVTAILAAQRRAVELGGGSATARPSGSLAPDASET